MGSAHDAGTVVITLTTLIDRIGTPHAKHSAALLRLPFLHKSER